jgi:hypothetical protein
LLAQTKRPYVVRIKSSEKIMSNKLYNIKIKGRFIRILRLIIDIYITEKRL